MYNLLILEGVGETERATLIDRGNDFDRLNAAKEKLSAELLHRGLHLDQARVAMRPSFVPCEPGLCTRCDEARANGSALHQ